VTGRRGCEPGTLAGVPDPPPRAVLSPSFRLVFRLEIANRPGMFAQVATVVGERGCSLGAIDLVEATPAVHLRDVTVDCPDERPYDIVRDAIDEMGLSLTRLEQRRHRLEDLFRDEPQEGDSARV